MSYLFFSEFLEEGTDPISSVIHVDELLTWADARMGTNGIQRQEGHNPC